ncbi:hypothetical protein T4B_11590 [Trichinella pseudospiralis]|uniref:Uncharacterized protein n=1 Tax=Trichinella pseudospiralis TaxID=6337 RepID=A0A0V1K751_TRIPS|nr:hypothetical protein T4B_11590 [Trichinella pseudospiralis]KRZ43074.1 hypothetical protein T4C_11228 [Trichinella pseudospiralis]
MQNIAIGANVNIEQFCVLIYYDQLRQCQSKHAMNANKALPLIIVLLYENFFGVGQFVLVQEIQFTCSMELCSMDRANSPVTE